MAKSSEARLRANAKYASKTYSALTLRYRKDDEVFPMLEQAAGKTGMSKAEDTKKALYSQFEKDGIKAKTAPEETLDEEMQEELRRLGIIN